jgi:hypothetical protein
MDAATSSLTDAHFALDRVVARQMLHLHARLRSAQKIVTSKIHDRRLTGFIAGLYCAPFQPKRVFRDFPAIDGPRKRAILGSSPQPLSLRVII